MRSCASSTDSRRHSDIDNSPSCLQRLQLLSDRSQLGTLLRFNHSGLNDLEDSLSGLHLHVSLLRWIKRNPEQLRRNQRCAISQRAVRFTQDVLDQSFMNDVNQQMLKRAKDFGLDDLDVNISVIPNRVYKFDNQSMN